MTDDELFKALVQFVAELRGDWQGDCQYCSRDNGHDEDCLVKLCQDRLKEVKTP
jgi:hypothetical protein